MLAARRGRWTLEPARWMGDHCPVPQASRWARRGFQGPHSHGGSVPLQGPHVDVSVTDSQPLKFCHPGLGFVQVCAAMFMILQYVPVIKGCYMWFSERGFGFGASH